jgi:pilus assembly protein FimV
MKFRSVKGANGNIFVEVSSKEVVKEVFLNFIMEVGWNKGLLYREFTVLLDPPSDYRSTVISPIPQIKPITNNWIQFPSPEVSKKIDKKEGMQYGPTKRADYIREIAKKTRYNETSIEQMTLALFKANPEAFSTDNINALRSNKILKIPDKKNTLEISRKEASEQVNQQNNAWIERIAARKNKTIVVADLTKNNSKASFEASGANSTKLASPNPNNNAIVNNVDKANEKPLTSTSNTDISAILTKLDKLEQKMELMQNVLIAKDKPAVTSANEAPTNTLASSAEGAALLTKQRELEQKLETMQKMLTARDELIVSLQEQNKALTALQGQNKLATASQEKPMPTPVPKLATTQTSPQNSTEPESSSIMQILGTNFMLLLQIATGGVFLVSLGYFLRRNNQKKKKKNEDEALKEYLKPLDLARSSFKDLSVSFNDFLSDHKAHGIDVEHNEIDVCTEVDICLTYNYYANAESLIRQAIASHSENNDYKLKLLEVLLVSKNKTGFDEFKTQLVRDIKHDNQEFWDKVYNMENSLDSETYLNNNRKQITPETLEKSIENTMADTEITKNAQTIEDNEIDFYRHYSDETNMKPMFEEYIETIADSQTEDNHEIAFDMGNSDEVKPVVEEYIESIGDSQKEDDHEIDFDMYNFEKIEVTPVAEEYIKIINKSQPAGSDEVVFDMYDFEEIEAKPVMDENITVTNEFIFDLSEFDGIEVPPTMVFKLSDDNDAEVNPTTETSPESANKTVIETEAKLK